MNHKVMKYLYVLVVQYIPGQIQQ